MRMLFTAKALMIACLVLIVLTAYCLWRMDLDFLWSRVMLTLLCLLTSLALGSVIYLAPDTDRAAPWARALLIPTGLAFLASSVFAVFCFFIVIIHIATYGSDRRIAELDQQIAEVVEAEKKVAADWYLGLDHPSNDPSVLPPLAVKGKYLEMAEGGSAGILDGFQKMPGTQALLHIPGSHKSGEGLKGFGRNDGAQFVVVIDVYSTHPTQQSVTVYTKDFAGGGPIGSGRTYLRKDTAISAVVSVYDRASRQLLARRDFSQPEMWQQVHDDVEFDRTWEIDDWLRRAGLDEADWIVEVK